MTSQYDPMFSSLFYSLHIRITWSRLHPTNAHQRAAVSTVEVTTGDIATMGSSACPRPYICTDVGMPHGFHRARSCLHPTHAHQRAAASTVEVAMADITTTGSRCMPTSIHLYRRGHASWGCPGYHRDQSLIVPSLPVMSAGPLLTFYRPALILCQIGVNRKKKIQKITNVVAPFLRSPLIDCIIVWALSQYSMSSSSFNFPGP